MTMRNENGSKNPWGMVAGLLTFALVVLIGVTRGLEPLVVLQRGLMGAAAMAFIVAVVVQLLGVAMAPRKRRSWQR